MARTPRPSFVAEGTLGADEDEDGCLCGTSLASLTMLGDESLPEAWGGVAGEDDPVADDDAIAGCEAWVPGDVFTPDENLPQATGGVEP
jgi:hypothetical protein